MVVVRSLSRVSGAIGEHAPLQVENARLSGREPLGQDELLGARANHTNEIGVTDNEFFAPSVI